MYTSFRIYIDLFIIYSHVPNKCNRCPTSAQYSSHSIVPESFGLAKVYIPGESITPHLSLVDIESLQKAKVSKTVMALCKGQGTTKPFTPVLSPAEKKLFKDSVGLNLVNNDFEEFSRRWNHRLLVLPPNYLSIPLGPVAHQVPPQKLLIIHSVRQYLANGCNPTIAINRKTAESLESYYKDFKKAQERFVWCRKTAEHFSSIKKQISLHRKEDRRKVVLTEIESTNTTIETLKNILALLDEDNDDDDTSQDYGDVKSTDISPVSSTPSSKKRKNPASPAVASDESTTSPAVPASKKKKLAETKEDIQLSLTENLRQLQNLKTEAADFPTSGPLRRDTRIPAQISPLKTTIDQEPSCVASLPPPPLPPSTTTDTLAQPPDERPPKPAFLTSKEADKLGLKEATSFKPSVSSSHLVLVNPPQLMAQFVSYTPDKTYSEPPVEGIKKNKQRHCVYYKCAEDPEASAKCPAAQKTRMDCSRYQKDIEDWKRKDQEWLLRNTPATNPLFTTQQLSADHQRSIPRPLGNFGAIRPIMYGMPHTNMVNTYHPLTHNMMNGGFMWPYFQ